ncbi:hypothetical protein VRU48_13585 [Pedobacter sp. KR3-3]|uniref:Natural product n=1 Tax=Pedobacter albus TaxID=3113905 RepID=A0ABU7IAF0_9SPHI|nr:hypothetical protein [Pedobacter sp. KR3-3]MEE1946149.1 hypothetical protein [Pedobacter sp. KR3-3]
MKNFKTLTKKEMKNLMGGVPPGGGSGGVLSHCWCTDQTMCSLEWDCDGGRDCGYMAMTYCPPNEYDGGYHYACDVMGDPGPWPE